MKRFIKLSELQCQFEQAKAIIADPKDKPFDIEDVKENKTT